MERGGDTGVDLLSLELAQAVCQQLSYLEEPAKGKRKSGGEGDKRERGGGGKNGSHKIDGKQRREYWKITEKRERTSHH